MKELNLPSFKFVGLIVVSVFLFFAVVPVCSAVSETRYHRSDQQTVNGLTGYALNTSNSASGDTSFASGGVQGGGCPGVKWKADVYKRDAGGTETLLGGNVAVLAGQYNGEQSATWAAPETSLSSTDAVKLVEKLTSATDVVGPTRTWITPQLGAAKLDAATWTFVRYCYYGCMAITPPFFQFEWGLYHGSSTYNTRIDGFSYTPAVDCGLRVYNGIQTLTIACEPSGTLTSALRIRKGDTTYGVFLVSTSDAYASNMRISTSSGVKALKIL